MENEEIKGCAEGCNSCASGCGDSAATDSFDPIITLTDEEGKDVKFEILDVVVLEDSKEFLVVSEVLENKEGDVEVTILSITQDGEEEVYDTVIDEELAKKVFDEFIKQQEELDDEEIEEDKE